VKLEMENPPSLKRACGFRKKGGIYIEIPMATHGVPLAHFLLDPPVPSEYGPLRGAIPIEHGGVTHVLSWVGESYYPFPADFFEEARRFGISRRVPRTFPVERLSPKSWILFEHRRAVPKERPPTACPRDRAHPEGAACAGHLFHLPGEEGLRENPAGLTYPVREPAIEEWTQGLFLAVPLAAGRVVAVKTENEEVQKANEAFLEAARQVGLAASVVDE